MELAVETGIPPSVWAAEDEVDVLTAVDVIDERRRAG